ncbi:hypothetical protein PFISCL1PPCAC_10920 [Pristionchus fissidentatus]|uniref:Small integral membrane protein 14 n=1 Tax=Pristionchus fissidentatus TaxID=1538716 RepID=A0AAV5VJU2_9BILA|nr:hypothetical protein PFISCL1PPCAC_10920 [Pristionchus fissidentatus]
MSDDPCECLWNHEMSMRRLLSLLRNSQDECTDGDCLGSDGVFNGPQGMMMWSMLWGLIALALFFLRPRSLRNNGPDTTDPANEKRPQGGSGGQDHPEPPPPGVN